MGLARFVLDLAHGLSNLAKAAAAATVLGGRGLIDI